MSIKKPLFADLNDLVLLLHVSEQGGYSAASRILGISKSTISQRIAALESAIGTAVLRRTPRSISLTTAGTLLLPYARTIQAQASEAAQSVGGIQQVLAGTLRVSTSSGIAQFALAPLLAGFIAQYPRVNVQLDVTNRYVDLIGEGYDLGVRAYATQLRDSTLRHCVVARTEWSLAASPGWLASTSAIARPEDLVGKEILHFSVLSKTNRWTLKKGGISKKIPVAPHVVCDDMAVLLSMAVAHAGIVALPTYVMADVIGRGLLVPVLPGWTPLVSKISILTPTKRQSSKLAAILAHHIASELRSRLSAHAAP